MLFPIHSAKDREAVINSLACDGSEVGVQQDSDPDLRIIKQYLKDGELPLEEQMARKLVLSRAQYKVIDDVLYHVEPDKTLRVIPPVHCREALFKEAHNGLFGGHLRSVKIHGQLAKHYWWPGMRGDIVKWSQACMVCATRQVSKPIHPFLSPIPVSGPFDQVGVDVIKFTASSKGNKYAIVFVDYLTK